MAFLSSIALRSGLIQRYSFRQSLFTSALASTAAVMAYGAATLISSELEVRSSADRLPYSDKYVLKYADGVKAIFQTEDGVSLVMIGSSLSTAGKVASIEKRNGRWTVTTSKNLSFVQN